MPALIQEQREAALATLRQLLLSQHNAAMPLPSPSELRFAIGFLAGREPNPSEFTAALQALEQFPPIFNEQLMVAAHSLVARADAAPELSEADIAADSKMRYLRSSQYDLEGPINWVLLIAGLLATAYLALLLRTHIITSKHLLIFACTTLPLVYAVPQLLRPREKSSVFERYLRYTAINLNRGISYQDWLRGYGRGTDVRRTRRQSLLIAFCYTLFMAIFILKYVPAQ